MKILKWSNSDKENQGMLKLIDNVYDEVDIKNPKYIDWQYNKNPQGQAIIVLGIDEGKNDFIIGKEAVIPSDLKLENKLVKASISLNSIVHTDYRRQGIFSKLVSALPNLALKEGIVCVYGIPNSNSHKAFLKEGWKEIAQIPLLVRILKPSNYFNNALKTFFASIDFFWKIKNNEQLQIEEYTGDFSDFDPLTSKLGKRILVLQNRNHKYLRWRYKEHPTRKYKTYFLKKDSEIICYIITRETEFKGKPIGVILDFVTNGDKKNEKDFLNLVKSVLLKLQNKGSALTIATFPPSTLEYKILRKAGFFNVPDFIKPETLPLIVNIFDKNNQDLKIIEKYDNWFFTFGDYDVF